MYQNSVKKDIDELIPIKQKECEEFQYEGEGGATKNGTWVRVPPTGIPAPDCLISPYGRDNHNGNGPGGQFHTYKWTVPNDINENCVMRIRYNVSTGDFPRDGVDAEFNNRQRQISRGPDVRSMYGLGVDEGADRGYEIKNNPQVQVFSPEIYPDLANFKLQHAVNTAQYGRTFQDRTHTFGIRKRPDNIPESAVINNLNVRGKRGNIVQVYPAVEYDYVPNTLRADKDSYIHAQWSGSNNNPQNNDGQGRAGTDRSNIILMEREVFQEGAVNPADRYGAYGRSYPQHINESSFMGLTREDRQHLGLLENVQYGGDMTELNAAGTYYNAGPRKVTGAGTYHYMCTRNNNFSNRSQKGKIIVAPSIATVSRTVDKRGGSIRSLADDPAMMMAAPMTDKSSAHFDIQVPPDALKTASLEVTAIEEEPTMCAEMVQCPAEDAISNFVNVYPQGPMPLVDGKPLTMSMTVSDYGQLHEPVVYYTTDNGATWYRKEIDSIDGATITFSTSEGASYIVTKSLLIGTVAALSVGLIFGIMILVAICVVYKKNKGLFSGYGNKI